MKGKIQVRYAPDNVSIPGETILETINELGISQAGLADRLGRPENLVDDLIKGKSVITNHIASQLEEILGVPASFWNNLERAYRISLKHDGG